MWGVCLFLPVKSVQLGEVSHATLTLRPNQPVSHARVFASDPVQLEVSSAAHLGQAL